MAGFNAVNDADDDRQPISKTEDTIIELNTPKMTEVAVVQKGSEAKNDEDKKDHGASRRTFNKPQAAQNSRLCTIPAKIRNMIFKLCLTHPKDIGDKLRLRRNFECFMMVAHYPQGVARPKVEEAYEQSITKVTKRSVAQHSFRNLCIMRTCQTMYNEAAPVFWGQPFTFRTIVQLQSFLLNPNMRHDLVRDVNVLKLDYNIGINYMPGICVLMADKLKNLEVFEIDMAHMRSHSIIKGVSDVTGFRDDEHLKEAGKNLGFGIYSCMHPWVTEVVRKQGIDKFMSILQIVREEGLPHPDGPVLGYLITGVFRDFQGRGQLTAEQRKMADTETGKEILRQIDIYKQKL